MKYNNKKSIQLLKSVIILMVFTLMAGTANSQEKFELFAVSDLVRVFEDGYELPEKKESVETFGIRGEILSGQVAILALTDLDNVNVSVSSLKGSSSGKVLPSSIVDWSFIGSVSLPRNAPNQLHRLVRDAPADFPDYLMEENTVDVPGGTYKAVWLNIDIPENAQEGSYEGTVSIRANGEEKSLPLKVRIYPLDMPTERGLKVAVHYDTKDFSKFHNIDEQYSDEWFAMLKKYAENMVAHRQNIFIAHMRSIGIEKQSDNSFEFDFSIFDRIAETFWNTGGMDYLETGYMLTRRGEGGWEALEIELNDILITDATTGEQVEIPGEEVIPVLLPEFEAHLREKGWLDKTYLHVLDEPSLHNAKSWIEMSKYLHNLAPGMTRMDALNTPYLMDYVEVAVPMLDHLAAMYDQFKEGQRNGTELWFYTTGVFQASSFPNKTIDMPLMDNRVMHWLNYKYDIPGFLHWGWNRWNENPLEEMDDNLGDAWHVYPSENGVLNSLRWEQLRNGLQDYEYFKLLEEKMREFKNDLGPEFEWIDPAQRSREIAGEIVQSLVDYKYEPETLHEARKEVITEILNFDSSPMVYVQTHPEEFTVLKNRASVEIFGWAEPGTKIVVNGEELPVHEDGLFLHIFNLTHSNDKIQVQASFNGKTKTIEREFEIEY